MIRSFNICSIMLLPCRKPACSSAMLLSAWCFSLFKMIFNTTSLPYATLRLHSTTYAMVRHEHSPNKRRTNLRMHRPTWKYVCSTSHTKTEGPTYYGAGEGKLIDIISNVRKKYHKEHIIRIKDDSWSLHVTTMRHYDRKIRQRRPAKRW